MHRVPLFVCLLLAATAAHADTRTVQRAIVDGQPATAGELYSTVALAGPSDGVPFCTGTLIAPTVVVTAAHCLVEQDEDTDAVTRVFSPSEVEVVAGALDAYDVYDDQVFAVSALQVHADYPTGDSSESSGLGRDDDVAVLILSDPITSLPVAPVLALADFDAQIDDGSYLIITGYGLLEAGSEEAGLLYIAETPFVRRSQHEFLAGGPGHPDTCQGDSGGPVYAELGGQLYLVGASSRAVATSAAACGEGGIYSLLPAYEGWLRTASGGAYSSGGPVPPDGGAPDGGGSAGDDDGCAAAAGPSPTSTLIVLLLALFTVGAGRRRAANVRDNALAARLPRP